MERRQFTALADLGQRRRSVAVHLEDPPQREAIRIDDIVDRGQNLDGSVESARDLGQRIAVLVPST